MLENKNKFLSIGRLSKLTGVHIKSLRYYDKIGILKPAYVDPESSYRYYSHEQLSIVEAIQTCIELDIPLKNFPAYIEEKSGQIHYARLLKHGKECAEQKIRSIQEKLAAIEEYQQEIERAEQCRNSEVPLRFLLPEKYCWLTVYEPDRSQEEYRSALNRMILEIINQGYRIGYETGLLFRFSSTGEEHYLFAEVWKTDLPFPPNVCYFKAGEYLCQKAEQGSILSARRFFPDEFEQDYVKIVIETEMFTGDYDFSNPFFELRCSLP